MKAFDNTEELGIDETKRITNSFGWIFREITKRDVGLDAFVETPEGYFIYFQIKTGPSHFYPIKEGLTFYFEERHFIYWRNIQGPVFIIGHLPESKETFFVKFELNKVSKTEKKYKIVIPIENKLTEGSKNQLLDEIIQVAEPRVAIGFDEQLDSISFTSEAIDFGRLRELGFSKEGTIYATDQKVIEVSKLVEQTALLWDNVLKCRLNIQQGTDIVKWRLSLIHSLMKLKEVNHAQIEIYILLRQTKDQVDVESKLLFQLARLLKYLLENHESYFEEVKELKEVIFYQIDLIGKNLDLYPDLSFIPIITSNGKEKEYTSIYNHGLIVINDLNDAVQVGIKIRVSYVPDVRDDKKPLIEGAKVTQKQGFALKNVVYEEFSIPVA